ncbi:MAG: hypothetical protein ABJA82_08580 [Myxococcales bacterium]
MTRNFLFFLLLAACAFSSAACDGGYGLGSEGGLNPGHGCLYDGKVRLGGEAFPATDGCNSCSCTGGGVACTTKACPSTPPAADKCLRAGCSGELCVEESKAAGLVTTCEWRPEYACYKNAACERQPGGACGFTPTPELKQCLGGDSTGCDYNGKHYATGASFPSADSCNSCSCDASGAIGCTLKACPPEPVACRRTGCSGQICAAEDIASTCEWRPEYACYKSAACERQSDGTCGFTPTPELKQCLGGGSPGCDYNGKHYAPGASFPSADSCNKCSCDASGAIGCTLKACPPPSAGTCRRTGCSGQICAAENVASTCEWRPEYACYKDAACERQPTGACGFTPSDAIKVCLQGAH